MSVIGAVAADIAAVAILMLTSSVTCAQIHCHDNRTAEYRAPGELPTATFNTTVNGTATPFDVYEVNGDLCGSYTSRAVATKRCARACVCHCCFVLASRSTVVLILMSLVDVAGRCQRDHNVSAVVFCSVPSTLKGCRRVATSWH